MHRTFKHQTSIYSQCSDDSDRTESTAPTQYTNNSHSSFPHNTCCVTPRKTSYNLSPSATDCARSSTETYASSIASEEDADLTVMDQDDLEYELPEYHQIYENQVAPSTSSTFAQHFPTARRMCVSHDDTTPDGNMNLRIDTETRSNGTVQLFHLRMQDLRKQDFSLRRYERSSGREVCHSSRKYLKPASERPALTKSVSNAFSSFCKPDLKRSDTLQSQKSQKSFASRRQDSGYGSGEEEESQVGQRPRSKRLPIPTNTTKLEFCNYAQVEVKRRGTKSAKRYEFAYWGSTYIWKRLEEKTTSGLLVSFHLYKGTEPTALAHIVPEMRSPSQIARERARGEWIPRSSMWLSDSSLIESKSDVCEVVVATGLVALVDDCIKRHFFQSRRESFITQIKIPLTPLKYDVEFISPKAMMEKVLTRRTSASTDRGARSSPLRRHTDVMAT